MPVKNFLIYYLLFIVITIYLLLFLIWWEGLFIAFLFVSFPFIGVLVTMQSGENITSFLSAYLSLSARSIVITSVCLDSDSFVRSRQLKRVFKFCENFQDVFFCGTFSTHEPTHVREKGDKKQRKKEKREKKKKKKERERERNK